MASERTPKARFGQQRRGAKKRGIGWEITFDEWWGIWRDSGHWEERGTRANQYGMARYGDVGPYHAGNVYITTCSENIKDYHRLHAQRVSANSRRGNLKRSLRNARGWTLDRRPKAQKNPYRVMYSSRHIGSFATQEEAERAHREIVLAELARA